MIVDTSALLAYFDLNEPTHEACARSIETADELVVSPYVVAELDYLIATRIGVEAELAALRELGSGAWDLATFGPDQLTTAAQVVERYADQQIGVTDASMVVLAESRGTRTIATLDHRHFDVVRPLSGGRFRLVP